MGTQLRISAFNEDGRQPYFKPSALFVGEVRVPTYFDHMAWDLRVAELGVNLF